jgi:hypothetical protein
MRQGYDLIGTTRSGKPVVWYWGCWAKVFHFPSFVRAIWYLLRKNDIYEVEAQLVALTIFISLITGAMLGGKLVDMLWRGF